MGEVDPACDFSSSRQSPGERHPYGGETRRLESTMTSFFSRSVDHTVSFKSRLESNLDDININGALQRFRGHQGIAGPHIHKAEYTSFDLL
jgi:hypothetical protein